MCSVPALYDCGYAWYDYTPPKPLPHLSPHPHSPQPPPPPYPPPHPRPAFFVLARYPGGSVVGFSLDEKGRPLFAFSSMSAHTGDLAADSRVSLTVTSATFKVEPTAPRRQLGVFRFSFSCVWAFVSCIYFFRFWRGNLEH